MVEAAEQFLYLGIGKHLLQEIFGEVDYIAGMGADAAVGICCPVNIPLCDENQISLMYVVNLVFDEIETIAGHQVIYFVMLMLMLVRHCKGSVQFIIQDCKPNPAHR